MKRILLLVFSMTLLIAPLLLGQRGPRPGERGGFGINGLKNALGLTDAQVNSITALIQGEQSRIEAIRTEITQKRQALDALLNSASPVPTDVGNAAIALHASEAKMKAEQDSLIAQIKQPLTGDQQQKLDALIAERGGRGFPFFAPDGVRPGGRFGRAQ